MSHPRVPDGKRRASARCRNHPRVSGIRGAHRALLRDPPFTQRGAGPNPLRGDPIPKVTAKPTVGTTRRIAPPCSNFAWRRTLRCLELLDSCYISRDSNGNAVFHLARGRSWQSLDFAIGATQSSMPAGRCRSGRIRLRAGESLSVVLTVRVAPERLARRLAARVAAGRAGGFQLGAPSRAVLGSHYEHRAGR